MDPIHLNKKMFRESQAKFPIVWAISVVGVSTPFVMIQPLRIVPYNEYKRNDRKSSGLAEARHRDRKKCWRGNRQLRERKYLDIPRVRRRIWLHYWFSDG